jgi:hypothetical protein
MANTGRRTYNGVVSSSTAYRIAGLLRYAALQFTVLTGCAMVTYAGGRAFDQAEPRYRLAGNFLSDLGRTRAYSGRTNHVSCALFFFALASLGIALASFAWTWPAFAWQQRRARWAGRASAGFGTLSGLAFVGVAVTPFDLALTAHMCFVLSAFGCLALYVATLTLAMWQNGTRGTWLAINLGYLVVVGGYVAFVLAGPHLATPRGFAAQVLGQKVVAYASMVHAVLIATLVRRALHAARPGS